MSHFPHLPHRTVHRLERCIQAVPTWVVALVSVLLLSLLVVTVRGEMSGLAVRSPIAEKQKVLTHLLDDAEAIAIMVAVILYIKGAPDRKTQRHYEAWRVIDTAANVATSYARYKALEDLHRDGVSLQWLEAPNSNLSGIMLPKANLRACNLAGANLERANLRGADLGKANLAGANLNQADLVGCNLTAANLEGAKLRGTTLWKADLWEADLSEAELRWAEIDKTQLEGAKLSRTILPDGSLCGGATASRHTR